MEWSNLNEYFSHNTRQMIEQFFQNSNSPTNADISLNFTRTSRQMGSNQKPNKDLSSRLQMDEKRVNPESDIFALADKQLQKFDSWIKGVNINKQNISQQIDAKWQFIEKELFNQENQQKPLKNPSSLENSILQKVDELHKKILNSHSNPKSCQYCQFNEKKIIELQINLKRVESSLETKNLQLNKIAQTKINELGYQMSFEVENRLLNQQIQELMKKNVQLQETIQTKNLQLNKLHQEINKFHFEKSNFLSKTKTLENRLHEMEKSKSLLMSAAKNSTSHSEFNITTTNNTNQTMLKSQNQTNIDTTFIHTNQFSADKPSADDYCQWFDRLKQIYLEKYKKEEKQHLRKHPQLKNNEVAMKLQINNFKKGHARYEVARSWNTIANYVSKNKENFVELISHELSPSIKIPFNEVCANFSQHNAGKETSKTVEVLEDELKEFKKKEQGHLSEIENLNQQLRNMKKTLLKQKEEKTKLSREVDQLHEQMEEIQQGLEDARAQLSQNQLQNHPSNNFSANQSPYLQQLVHQLQENLLQVEKDLQIKSEQLQKAIYDSKCQEQSQLKLSQSLKECERLLYKERVEKIRYFKESLPSQCLTTACRIRAKSISEKNLTSIIHEFQGRVYVDKEKFSYRFDLVEQVEKKSNDEIYSTAKKILASCIYEPTSSVILTMGSADSEFREYFRGQNGLLWSSISQMFKLKFSEKRFLQIDIALSVLEISNSQIIDLMDNDRRKKVTLKRSGQKSILENCVKLQFQTQQQAKSTLNQVFSKQHEINSQIVTIMEFTITDRRNKQKFTSKIYFTEITLQNSSAQNSEGSQNLIKDVKSLWNTFNCINFKLPYQSESNRLTCLLSDCFAENSKILMVINVSPIEFHKQNSLNSLNYASSLKYLPTEKPQSLIRYTEKTPEHSVSKLQHNSSHSLIQTPTLNSNTIEEKTRSITKHRNSSSEHTIYAAENVEKRKRTISRLSIC